MADPTWESLSQDIRSPTEVKTPTWEELTALQKQYGEGVIPQAKAFGLGAARSASFGLSDQFLVKSGAMKPEDIKAYREYNPDLTTAGEVAGVVGAVLLPEAGILKLAGLPVKAVAGLGGAATRAVLPAAESLAASASPVVSKILSQGAATAVGSAVEGAAYGLGQNISEQALGDPDLTAEKVLSNMGTSALYGGALGATFGALKGGIQAKFPKFLSEVDKANIDKGDWETITKTSDLTEGQKETLIAGLTKKKANAPQIEAAAASLDAPVLPSMLSDSKLVKEAQSSLMHGAPSIPGIKANQLASQALDKVEEATANVLGAGKDISKVSLGENLKNLVTENVEKQVAPINALYDELKTQYKIIPANAEEIANVANKIRNLEDVPLSPQAKAIANSAADRLESIKSIDDVKKLKSILNQELGLSATPIQKRTTSIIADELADLESKSIVNFAESIADVAPDKEKILGLLETRKAANAQYTIFKDKLDKLGKVLGRKRIHGASDFVSFLDDITPEKVADKLSSKDNAKFLDWFSKEMPEAMDAISQYKKGLLQEGAMVDGKLQVNKVLRELKKLPDEYKSKIFTPQELEKLGAIQTYMEAFPKNFNPSNTSNMSAFRSFMESPVGAVLGNARDFAIQGFIDAASTGNDSSKLLISGLSTLERGALKTAKSIKNGVAEIFSDKDITSPLRGYIATQFGDRKLKYDEIHPKITSLSNNPEKLIEHLTENTKDLSEVAPRISQSIQGTMVRATQFLTSKLPAAPDQKALSARYEPSVSELAKWYKYFHAIEAPTEVLQSVAQGTLAPESMEALEVVYPKLLAEMRVAVMEKVTSSIEKKKAIPYKTKLSLSLFLNTDLVNSLESSSILSNQNTLDGSRKEKQSMDQLKPRVTGMKEMNKANRFKSSFQMSSQREEKS